MFPDRLRHAARGQLRILSLGCSSGDEAYSIAILAQERLVSAGCGVSILGVDLNAAMIDKARQGRFSSWALRDTSESETKRWFRMDGRQWVLKEPLRVAVRFEEHNLLDQASPFWQAGTADVIFCRNVLMYFAAEQAQAVVARMARALRPGGYLFLGHAETLRGLSTGFHLCHTHGAFYYQRKDGDEPPAPQLASHADSLTGAALAEVAVDADSWVDAIRRASDRVTALTEPAYHGGNRRAAVHPVKPQSDLGVVLDLLRQERFTEALGIVDAMPPESGRDHDVLLLRAVLLAHGGLFTGAEDACRRLLEVDELNAGAHYLLALCREAAGDQTAAVHHDQVAAYLDPGFAMPRLHLGLLARRTGQEATARHELVQALVLLQREDASRVLLFGGGFGRQALVTLCGAELSRCGGQP